MKKLIVSIIILLACKSGGAQYTAYPIGQALGNNSSTIVNTNTIKATQGVVFGSFTDTTSANLLPYLKFYTGVGIWCTGDSSFYINQKSAYGNFWFKVGGAAGGAGGSSWTIGGNPFTVVPAAGPRIGTTAVGGSNFIIMTNGVDRLTFAASGLANLSAGTDSVLVRSSAGVVGVVAKTAIGATPTWQQTLDATNGKILTANNTVDAEGYVFKIIDSDQIEFRTRTRAGIGTNTYSTVDPEIITNVLRVNDFSKSTEMTVDSSTTYGLHVYLASNGSAGYSDVHVGENHINIHPIHGRLIIDSLNRTTDPSGYEVMVRNMGNDSVKTIPVASLGVPISSLTAATGANSINNGNFTQTLNWNSLLENTALYIQANTTGADGTGQILTRIALNGTNGAAATSYSLSVENNHSGSGSENVGIRAIAAGGANGNYAIIVPASSGDVGIGTSLPTSKLHVVSTQTTGIGSTFTSSTTTTGSILNISGTSTALAANNEGLNIDISGANGTSGITATGARIQVVNSNGVSGTNVGLKIISQGATTANIGLDLGEAGSSTGRMRIQGVTSGAITIQPASAAGTYTLTLPTTDGASGEFLQTDGSGVLTWAAASGATLTNTYVGVGDGSNLLSGTAALTYSAGVHKIETSATARYHVYSTGAGEQAQLRFQSNNGIIDMRLGGSASGFSDYWFMYDGNNAVTIMSVSSFATSRVLALGSGQTVGTQAGAVMLVGADKATMGKRFELQQGADVASAAGAITLGNDGNVFEITGTSAITLISNVNWQNGSEITLLFTSTASLTDGVANSGTDIGMELAGNANFTGSAGASVTLTLSEIGGVQRYREKCRSVN